MNNLNQKNNFTLPLTLKEHQIAQQFYEYHSEPKKAKQVYLNTLAVQAVNFYLKCLGIPTDLEKSASWEPIFQTLANTADLVIQGQGRLECRPVLPDRDYCHIPPEVWSERLGYVIVQLNYELTEAELLGFVANVEVEELPLSDLHPITDLPEYLSQGNELSKIIPEPINLSHWLHKLFDTGWESIEKLFNLPQEELAFSFRETSVVDNIPAISTEGVKRCKHLNLSWQDEQQQVALCVGLKSINNSKFEIVVEVYPLGEQVYLPPTLQLTVIDETGKSVLQAEAGNSKGLEMQFFGESGEGFSIRVVWENFSTTEVFVI